MYLPQQCRTEDGYLVRQSLMKDVPYGFFTAAKKGCGFLAVYNAVRYFGLTTPRRKSTAISTAACF